jgi:ABC-type uncharacterized transport system ATPase subunit
MSPSVVEVRNLTKRFGGFTAVDGISFDIGRGEILGLFGPEWRRKNDDVSDDAGTGHTQFRLDPNVRDSTCRPIGRRFFSR